MIRIPHNAVLELTYRCNHTCKFCSCPWYAPNSHYPKGTELNKAQWIQVIDRLYDMGVKCFSISGGECLLKDCLPEILRYIHENSQKRDLPQQIVLISNGRNMSEDFLRLFKETGVLLSMSLPGIKTFEYHTGIDNARNVLCWFKRAKEYGIHTTLNVTVTRRNYNELYETIAAGVLSGASSVLLNRFLPGGRGLSHMNELLLTPKQLNGMLDTAEEVLRLCHRQGHVGTEFPFCVIDHPEKYSHIKVGTCCAAAKEFFVIGPSGEIRVCNHSPRIVGDILGEDPIHDMEYWNTFADSNYHPEACKYCKMLPICDCGCREVANILAGSPCGTEPSLDSALKPS